MIAWIISMDSLLSSLSSSATTTTIFISIIEIIILVLTLVLSYTSITLIYPILYPTIISYPWPSVDDNNNIKNKKLRIQEKKQCVVLAGSFNPPHNGHYGIIQYLSERYGQVIVVVGMNPKKTYLVSPQERAELVRKMIQHQQKTQKNTNVRVEVVSGYIWKTVKPLGASLFVRGIRSWELDGKDERTLHILNTWGPIVYGPLWYPIPTIFIQGQEKYNHISSTLIRTILLQQQQQQQQDSATSAKRNIYEELEQLVPHSIIEDVAQLYSR